MTVRLETTIQRWIGVSSDHKPITGIKEGSTFHESDTGEKFIWVNSDWVEDTSGPISDKTFNAAQDNIRRLAEHQYLASGLNIESDAGHYNFRENR